MNRANLGADPFSSSWRLSLYLRVNVTSKILIESFVEERLVKRKRSLPPLLALNGFGP